MRKNFTRLFIFVLIFVLTVSFVACKKNETEEKENAVTTTAAVTTNAPLDDADEWTSPIA